MRRRSINSQDRARKAAARFSIGIATAGAWSRLKRTTGSVAPPKQGKPKGSVLDAHADFIASLIDETPDITLDEIAARLKTDRAVTVVRTAVDAGGPIHMTLTAKSTSLLAIRHSLFASR